MYDITKVSVHLSRGITKFFPSNVGLKQGCNMSFCHPVTLGNIKLNNLLYADDLILISETRTGLQSCLDNLQAYCQKWKLTVNNKKTKVMVVEKRQSSA